MIKKISKSRLLFCVVFLSQLLFGQSPKVGAFYFDGWTEFQWDNYINKNYHGGAYNDLLITEFSERKPAYGWVTSTFLGIQKQIEDAKQAGLNFFIFNLYYCSEGGYDDCFLNNAIRIFQNIAPEDFRFSVMITNDTFDIGPIQWEETEKKILELFSHPSYYRVEGKPLVLVFQGNKMVDAFGNVRKFDKALRSLVNKSISQGTADPIVGIMNINRYRLNRIKSVDFVSFYNDPYAALRLRNALPEQKQFTNKQLREGTELYWQEMIGNAKKKFFIPTITAGWDTRPWAGRNEFGEWKSKLWYERRAKNDIKQATLNALRFNKAYNTHNPFNLIFVNSWNEYGEGSHISRMANGEFLGIGIREALEESNYIESNVD